LTNKLNNCFRLPQRADNPFPYDYYPELDQSEPLDPECSSFYQHLIGVMRWMVELGGIDIATEVSLLSSHLAFPCIIDLTYPNIDMGKFPQYSWTKFYSNIEEAIPVDMPEP
jgi:hypothetical protein